MMTTEIRDGNVLTNGELKPVVIVDSGENFENGGGNIPNHDKVEIVYCDNRQHQDLSLRKL